MYYMSKTLADAQLHYITMEKEMLAIIFKVDKFWAYLLELKVVIYINYATLKHLLSKKDAKQGLICWILLLQEFDMVIKDNKGSKNSVVDRLSRMEGVLSHRNEEEEINNIFPNELVLAIQHTATP